MDEICRSNIIQRDNLKFAKKLNKELVPLAKEKNKTVSSFPCKANILCCAKWKYIKVGRIVLNVQPLSVALLLVKSWLKLTCFFLFICLSARRKLDSLMC